MKIALYTHPQKDESFEKAEKIADLINIHGGEVYFDKAIFDSFLIAPERQLELLRKLRVVDAPLLSCDCDLMVCIGGDGTILRAAKIAAKGSIPIVGINSGRIGYLAELEENEISKLADIVSGKFPMISESRMLLCAEIFRNGKMLASELALNEAVISKGAVPRMLDIELRCSGKKICSYRADGIIAATPTGSTAYAMSAGGPIIDPSIDCLLTVPVCAYLAVNSSPVIYSPDTTVEIVFCGGRVNSAYLSVDGGDPYELLEGDRVRISKASCKVDFLKLRNIDFYKLLNLKLSGESKCTSEYASDERKTI